MYCAAIILELNHDLINPSSSFNNIKQHEKRSGLEHLILALDLDPDLETIDKRCDLGTIAHSHLTLALDLSSLFCSWRGERERSRGEKRERESATKRERRERESQLLEFPGFGVFLQSFASRFLMKDKRAKVCFYKEQGRKALGFSQDRTQVHPLR